MGRVYQHQQVRKPIFYREKCRSLRWPLSTDKDFVVFIKIFVTNGGYYPRYTSAPFIAFSFVLLDPADLKSMPDKFKSEVQYFVRKTNSRTISN